MADDLLIRFLSSEDADCPVCGYGLRGLTSGRCPECGVPVELAIRTPDSRMPAWVTGIVAVSMLTGFFVMLTIWLVVMMSGRGSMPPANETWPVYAGGPVGAGMLGARIAGRRRYRRSGSGWRWGVNAACAGTLRVLAGVFFAIVT